MMTQTTSYEIDNDSGAAVRARLNDVFAAIQSSNSGPTPPADTAPGMLWLDTSGSPSVLFRRNAADSDWVRVVPEIASQAEAQAGTDNTKLMTPLRAAQTARLFGNPAGAIIFHAAPAPPAGYLKANGAAVSRTTYADLFAAIGTTFGSGDGSTTFNLPDLRGEFPRGWDDGRGVDSGRSFGSAQLDQMQRITGRWGGHQIGRAGRPENEGIGAFRHYTLTGVDGTSQSTETASGVELDSANSPDARVSDTTDGETRSRNVALLACIKF